MTEPLAGGRVPFNWTFRRGVGILATVIGVFLISTGALSLYASIEWVLHQPSPSDSLFLSFSVWSIIAIVVGAVVATLGLSKLAIPSSRRVAPRGS